MRSDRNIERAHLAREMGGRLKALRLAAGFASAAAYARFLRVPPSTVRRCEAGTLVANHRLLALSLAIAERAGASLDWLIAGNLSPGAAAPLRDHASRVAIFPYWRARPGR
jgi:hypothetical protein